MRPPTLLYISNDQFSLAGVKVFLESRGYRVLLARTSRYACQLLESTAFDAIVFDSDMGDCVVQQMTLTIRNHTGGTPILLFASHRYSAVRTVPCDAFCTKLDGNEALAFQLTNLLSDPAESASGRNSIEMVRSRDQAFETR